MNSKKWMVKALSASILAVGLGATSSVTLAANYPDFTINENSVPGTSPDGNPALVADRLNGLYTETFTPTFDEGSTTQGTFISVANWNISGYYNNDVLVPGALGCGFAACYNMYATLTASGTFNFVTATQIDFNAYLGAFNLFIDPDQTIGNADDYSIASSASLISGVGHINNDEANGNFDITWRPVLLTSTTPGGEGFFTNQPFYLEVSANGNFTENPFEGGVVSGSANAFFAAVPEPASLALLGLGLVGLGVSRRRKA